MSIYIYYLSYQLLTFNYKLLTRSRRLLQGIWRVITAAGFLFLVTGRRQQCLSFDIYFCHSSQLFAFSLLFRSSLSSPLLYTPLLSRSLSMSLCPASIPMATRQLKWKCRQFVVTFSIRVTHNRHVCCMQIENR